MHILRWLMKHPILLAWLLAIVAILLNFSVGGKQGGHGNEVAAEHGKNTPAVDAHAQPVVAPTAQAAPAVDAHAQQAAASTAQPANGTNIAANQQAIIETADQGVQASMAEAQKSQPEAAVPAPAQGAVDTSANQVAPSQPAADSANAPADLLRAAREAYWANELDRAVTLYSDLLKQTPDSLEYKGELANVYWKQGNAQQAATLFAEVAPRLVAQGRTTEALNMKLYVDMVNPELAKQIDAALKK